MGAVRRIQLWHNAFHMGLDQDQLSTIAGLKTALAMLLIPLLSRSAVGTGPGSPTRQRESPRGVASVGPGRSPADVEELAAWDRQAPIRTGSHSREWAELKKALAENAGAMHRLPMPLAGAGATPD